MSERADAGLLLSQVDTLSLEDLHAFIAQALCLPGKSAGQLADLQVLAQVTVSVLRTPGCGWDPATLKQPSRHHAPSCSVYRRELRWSEKLNVTFHEMKGTLTKVL